MEQKIKKFNINSYVLKNNCFESFVLNQDGSMSIGPEESEGFFVVNRLDSSQKGTKWGRVVVDAELPKDCEFNIYVMVSDSVDFVYQDRVVSYDEVLNSKSTPKDEKIAIFNLHQNSKSFRNLKDVLLIGLEGRYLWLFFDIKYVDKKITINRVLVYFPGDSLLKYFPEIYRKNTNDFFERYLSIFSSLNKDYQRSVDGACDLIDVDKAPDSMLSLLARWIGLDVEGNFLNNEQLRLLIKNAKYLNQYKGTVNVIEKIVELFLGVKPIIVEQVKIQKYLATGNFRLYQELYGTDPCEFLIILNKELEEEIFYQLKSLINMFKPARTKFSIIFLDSKCQVDGHCYIGLNSRLSQHLEGVLDQSRYLDIDVIVGS